MIKRHEVKVGLAKAKQVVKNIKPVDTSKVVLPKPKDKP